MQYLNAVSLGRAIGFKLINEHGERIKKTVKYQPSLFIPTKKQTKWRTHTVAGGPKCLERIKFSSMSEARKYVKDNEGMFPVYGNTRFEYPFISDFCDNNQKGFPDLDAVRIAYFDIEVASDSGFPDPSTASNPVTAITIYFSHLKKFVVLGCKDYEPKDKSVLYVKCQSESVLLSKFLDIWNNADFDIISGWNSSFFDLPYIYNRISIVLGEGSANRLSPWESVYKRTVIIFGKEHESISISGIDCLDYLDLYKKFVLPASDVKPENNRLNTVAHYELGTKKVDYSEYQSLDDLYDNDYEKFIDYNIQDVQILIDLEKKLEIIRMCIQLAYDARVNFQDVFSQVRMWDSIIFNHLKKENFVIPFKQDFDKEEKYEGAFVKEPQLGMHEWVTSFDLDSLYPNLILQFNISPETIVRSDRETKVSLDDILTRKIDTEKLREKNVCVCGSGHMFRVDRQGFLPAIIGPMYEQRKEYKRKAQEGKQLLKEIDQEIQRRNL